MAKKESGASLILELPNTDILTKHPFCGSREARTKLGKIVRAAREQKYQIVITEHGEPAAAVVSIDDLRILDWLKKSDFQSKVTSAVSEDISADELVKTLAGNRSANHPRSAKAEKKAQAA